MASRKVSRIDESIWECVRKMRYAERSEAEAHVRRLWLSGLAGEGLRPYKCYVCGLWHVGHTNFLYLERGRE